MEYSRPGAEFGAPLEDPGQQSVSNIFRNGDRRGEQTVRTSGHYAASLASVLPHALANRFLVSKKFLEYAPRWSGIALVSLAAIPTRAFLSSLPSPLLPHSPHPTPYLACVRASPPLHHRGGGAAPLRLPNPSRGPVESPHPRSRARARARPGCSGIALIRYRALRRSRAPARPLRARPGPLQSAAARPPEPTAAAGQRHRVQAQRLEESHGEPAKPAPCRPLPIPPRWTVCGATGKVRVFSLFR